jgi:hypothetical protein
MFIGVAMTVVTAVPEVQPSEGFQGGLAAVIAISTP